MQIDEFNYDSFKSNEKSFFDFVNYDYNMIGLPIFTVDRQVSDFTGRRYVFSEKEEKYIRIIPDTSPDRISNKILQEIDEKIFSVLLRLAEQQKNQFVITDYYSLANIAGLKYTAYLRRIKDSIERLRGCSLVCNNVLYDAKFSGGINLAKDYYFNLIASTEILEFSDRKKIDSSSCNDEYYKRIYDYMEHKKNLKTVLILQINDLFFSNIRHGYFMTLNKSLIFSLNAVARKLFLLIKQQQILENKKSFACSFIASRMPLSWHGSSYIKASIDSIERAAETLKTRGLIGDYTLTRTKPLKNSYIDFIQVNGEK